jgi:hypothetical protein
VTRHPPTMPMATPQSTLELLCALTTNRVAILGGSRGLPGGGSVAVSRAMAATL